MIHSASKLQKLSCSQLNYHYRHWSDAKRPSDNFFVKPEPSDAQKEGNKQALLHSLSPFVEMRSSIVLLGDTIYYSMDEIRHHKGKHPWLDKYYLIEHKLMGLEDWYLESAIIQTAFYRALHLMSDRQYVTATFFVDEGNPRHELNLSKKETVSLLQYGDLFYVVTVTNPANVLKFFSGKIQYSRDYNKSREFDAYWKRREWDYFKNCVSSRRWYPSEHFIKNDERLKAEKIK